MFASNIGDATCNQAKSFQLQIAQNLSALSLIIAALILMSKKE
jgi:hypothetical protein